MTFRRRIDQAFEHYGRWIGQHAGVVIVLSACLAAALASQARHVVLEFHPETFLDETHPARVRYNAFKAEFGSDDSMLLAIRSAEPWNAEFLGWLRDLHSALEERVPHVDEVTSIINARHTVGELDELVVEDLLEEWPRSQQEFEDVARVAAANPLYEKLLLDSEHQLVTLIIELGAYASDESGDVLDGFGRSEPAGPEAEAFLTGTQRSEAAQGAAAVVAEFARPDIEIHLVGSPVNGDRATGLMRRNMSLFTGLSFICIAGILGVLFRRATAVVLPLAVSLLSVAATFGVAGLRGSPLSVTVQIIPSLLLAVGVSASIHLVVIFFQQIDAGRSSTDAIAEALGHSGLPVVLASLTTAVGLASFNTAELAGLRDVGVLAPAGIATSLLLSLTLLPAVLTAVPAHPRPRRDGPGSPGPLERALVATGDFSTRRPVLVVCTSSIVVMVLALGIPRLEYVFDPLTFLHEDDPLRVSTHLMNEEFVGVSSIDFVLDTGKDNGLYDPDFVAGLQRIHELAPTLRGGTGNEVRVGKVVSFVDILKEIHQALNENRSQFYDVPGDRGLIAQELLLFESAGSDDLAEFVDTDFRRARLTLRVPWIDASKFGSFIPDTEALFREILGDGVTVDSTGIIPVATVIQEEMKNGLIRSYTMAVLIITPLMILLLGSVRGGLISMIPNLMPIIAVLGAMGWFGLELNIFTMLIGCIAIGLAVDDTIHFSHQFYRYRAASESPAEAVRSTMRTTGQALLTTSVVLSAGFFVYVAGGMRNLEALGIVTTASIVLAFLSDIVVAPALLTLVEGRAQARAGARAPAETERRTRPRPSHTHARGYEG